MTLRTRPVAVKQLPGKLNARTEKRFLREVEERLSVERPAMVLDCSAMTEMNSTTLHLLLCCLERAMKSNGDLRLSGVGPKARLNMALAGIDRLFRLFPTTREAIASFQRRETIKPAAAALQFAEEPAA